MPSYPPAVVPYADRLFSAEARFAANRPEDPQEAATWREAARARLREVLGVARIEAEAGDAAVTAELEGEAEDLGSYTRQKVWVQTEPALKIFCWLLRPKGDGPFPVALTPHGHESGLRYVGIDDATGGPLPADRMDQAVAVQAAERGYLTLAPATRGISANQRTTGLADIAQRHKGVDCVCHNWHAILAGRSAIGERVWDNSRVLDWASALPETDGSRVLMLGNSGGGMATAHTTACDTRITAAVPSCAFNNYVSPQGYMRHCPCNAAPGLMRFGEFWDVLGLAAPRHVLTVTGQEDPLHPNEEVHAAQAKLKAIYEDAGCGDRYEHRYGEAGHQFYPQLMWPWIEQAMA